MEKDIFFRTIALQGWERVVEALTAFATDALQKSQERAPQHKIAIIKDFDPDDLLLFEATSQNPAALQPFLNALIQKAYTALQQRKRWQHRYEYDGVGPFHKTSVEIALLDADQEIYSLGFVSSGRSDVEEKLAAYLQAERILQWCTLSLHIQSPTKTQFSVDFVPLVQKLQPLFPGKILSATMLAVALMTERDDSPLGDGPKAIFNTDESICVEIMLEDVVRRSDAQTGTFNWVRHSAVISGSLREEWEQPGKYVSPHLTLKIFQPGAFSDVFGYEKLPIWQHPRQQRIIELTNQIEKELGD